MKHKIGLLLCLSTLLTACAGSGGGLRENDLRQEVYLLGEYRIEGTFPEIQRALRQHQAACGNAAIFRMDERQASYGTLRYERVKDATWEDSILFDLTMLSSGATVAKAYSYRSGALPEVRAVLASIASPGVCDPQAKSTKE